MELRTNGGMPITVRVFPFMLSLACPEQSRRVEPFRTFFSNLLARRKKRQSFKGEMRVSK